MYTIIGIGDISSLDNAGMVPEQITLQVTIKPHKNILHLRQHEWGYFLQRTGLLDLFFGQDGLFTPDTTSAKITYLHLRVVMYAVRDYRERGSATITDDELDVDPSADDLRRLEWLQYWMQHTLENCQNPGIVII